MNARFRMDKYCYSIYAKGLCQAVMEVVLYRVSLLSRFANV